MASTSSIGHPPTGLEEFLAQPEEKPYREYVDGRIEAKVSPRARHSLLQLRLMAALLRYAEPGRLGLPFPELRCTFGGRSIVPDIAFLSTAQIERDAAGEPVDVIRQPPDLINEIRSPEQRSQPISEKITHAIAHGTRLGWLVDPDSRTVEVFRVGRSPVRLGLDGELEGEPALPGFRLSVAELFGWLRA